MKKTIAILNTKGGAGKSTVAVQVAATYFLQQGKNVDLFEFDDENKDAQSFSESEIKSKQIKVGDGKDISDILREHLLSESIENSILDIGGNKTTTIFIDGLKKSSIYKKVDLILIPISGGEQDTKNAIKTFNMIKDFKIPVIFVLSRVSNVSRLHWKFKDFFMYFPTELYIVLKESDVIELSRHNKRSIFEIATDTTYISMIDQLLDDAFDKNDIEEMRRLSIQKELALESIEYLEDTLKPAWQIIDDILGV